MPIVVNLDYLLRQREAKAKELAKQIGVTEATLSRIRTGQANTLKFETLRKICEALNCQPGDLLEYIPDGEEEFVLCGVIVRSTVKETIDQ